MVVLVEFDYTLVERAPRFQNARRRLYEMLASHGFEADACERVHHDEVDPVMLSEHGLGPERRFAYEEGIRAPFVFRYPRKIRSQTRVSSLVICQDIAPTWLELAGGRPGAQIQGRSLLPLFGKKKAAWRKSILVEYWAENAMPWLVGMTYKAVRTERHKYIHWVNRGRSDELDELYDLERDPYELKNLAGSRPAAPLKARLRAELRRLAAAALGL